MMYEQETGMNLTGSDQRVQLMERFVGLDQARKQAEMERDEIGKRLESLRSEMTSLRRELRSIIDEGADDLPKMATDR